MIQGPVNYCIALNAYLFAAISGQVSQIQYASGTEKLKVDGVISDTVRIGTLQYIPILLGFK